MAAVDAVEIAAACQAGRTAASATDRHPRDDPADRTTELDLIDRNARRSGRVIDLLPREFRPAQIHDAA